MSWYRRKFFLSLYNETMELVVGRLLSIKFSRSDNATLVKRWCSAYWNTCGCLSKDRVKWLVEVTFDASSWLSSSAGREADQFISSMTTTRMKMKSYTYYPSKTRTKLQLNTCSDMLAEITYGHAWLHELPIWSTCHLWAALDAVVWTYILFNAQKQFATLKLQAKCQATGRQIDNSNITHRSFIVSCWFIEERWNQFGDPLFMLLLVDRMKTLRWMKVNCVKAAHGLI